MAASGYADNWQSGKCLIECNRHMLESETSSDVSFRVGKEKKIVQAHRYVLISRSCVFSAMFCGPLAEKEEITITDVNAEEFTDFLRYLYTETPVLNPDNATTMLYLAKKYAVGSLESLSVSYLETCLCADNACTILEQAHSFDEKRLYSKALQFIQKEALTILCTSGFKDLCKQCFHAVLSLAEMKALPEQVFEASLAWSVAECWRNDMKATPGNKRLVLRSNLHSIFFPDMERTFFVKTVLPSKVLTDEEHVIILSYYICPDVDVSPFKTRFPKKQKSEKVKPIETFDLPLYDHHVRQNHPDRCDAKVCEDIYLHCSNTVLLHGLRIYGSGRQHLLAHKYHIKVFNCVRPSYGQLIYDFEVSLDGTCDMYGISSARVMTPLLLEKENQYHFQVRMIAGNLPLYGGKGKQGNNGDHVIVTKVGISPVNYTFGFVFSEHLKRASRIVEELKPKGSKINGSSQFLSVHL